jgi:hypothetical protein
MAYTINWDMVSSLARNKHIAKLKDNFFLSNALFYRWKGKQKEWEGGPVLVVPLGFAPEGGGGAWYSGPDKFDTTVRNPIKAANYFAKNAQVTIAIDSDEELSVKGPQQVLNLLEQKMKIAENTMVDLVGTNLFNTGTNAKAIGGLGIALPANITAASQTYGGITSGGSAPSLDPNGWWQNYGDAAGYTTGLVGTFMGTGVVAGPQGPVGTAWAACGLRSGKTPTVLVSNWGAWTDYHNSIAKNERYDRPQQSTDMAKAGFTNLMYRNAPWVVDERAPRGAAATYFETVYGIDEKAVSLYTHPSRNMHFEDFRKPIDQDAKVGYIFHRTELCFDERRSSFAINNINTSAVLAV